MFEKSNDPKQPYLLYRRRRANANRRDGGAANPRAARTCQLPRQERGPLLREGHPPVTHDGAVRSPNVPAHCLGRRSRTVQRDLPGSVSGPAARAGYRRSRAFGPRTTGWPASARRRGAIGAERVRRRLRRPSQSAWQGRPRIRSPEGSPGAGALDAGVADPGRSARRGVRPAGAMPREHRGCGKRHFHFRRRADSQVGARRGMCGRRRGR